MSVVALIGPDGAGKTTVARQLEKQLPMAVKYLYMGGMPDHSSLMLVTTRLRISLHRWRDRERQRAGEIASSQGAPTDRGLGRRWLVSLLNALLFMTGLAEEWLLQGIILTYELRGYLVLLDRHFLFHHHAYIVGSAKRPLPLGTRLHAFMLEHLYPRPDLVIYLDASPEVLFTRKGEKSVEILYELRERYSEMSDRVRHFIVLDANQSQEDVTREAAEVVIEFCAGQRWQGNLFRASRRDKTPDARVRENT